MGIKRKLEELDDSPGSSISNTSSVRLSSPSPIRRHQQAIEIAEPGSAISTSHWRGSMSSDPFYEPSRPMLNSRTRKRWRDNRPDIDTIHASTLQKLYDAQRQTVATSLQQQAVPLTAQVPSQSELRQPQTSLHAFWNIPVPQPPRDAGLFDTPSNREPDSFSAPLIGVDRCEDCDAVVTSDDMMDWDGIGRENMSHGECQHCSKRLCDACAVAKNAWLCIQCA